MDCHELVGEQHIVATETGSSRTNAFPPMAGRSSLHSMNTKPKKLAQFFCSMAKELSDFELLNRHANWYAKISTCS